MWSLRLSQEMAGVLLGFMVASTLLLIWGSRLVYSRPMFSVSLFISVSQWALLVMLAVLIGLRSPYSYTAPIMEGHPPIGEPSLVIHPVIRLSGNLMLFTIFFHLVSQRREHWTLRQSLLELGPSLVYFCLALFLRYTQAGTPSYPVT